MKDKHMIGYCSSSLAATVSYGTLSPRQKVPDSIPSVSVIPVDILEQEH